MKHLSGEKTDSKIGQLKNSFILFVLLFSSLTYSQIPVNGFCFQKNYSLPKEYQKIISADLNSDGNDELIFYSSSFKRLGIYSGIPAEQSGLKEFELNFEISQLKLLKNKSGEAKLFTAVERKHRKISLIYITLDSLSGKIGSIEFDSYPENIFTEDIDLNGFDEILVSGSGFDGLSILFRSNGGIGESKIITGTSFSEAIFMDLNDDGYHDVLAFNILENSLQFFINNTNGIFRLSHSIQYSEKINLLQSSDLNKDGLQDIIYAIGNRIEILHGDFQSSYKNKSSFKLEDIPAAIQFGDFNGDKVSDLAIGKDKSRLSVFFGKKNGEFHNRIPYLENSALTTFTTFKFENTDIIACVFGSGQLCVIKSEKELSDSMKLIPAIQAGALTAFDNENDGIPDLAFIEEYDNSLKIFLNSKNGIPKNLYNIQLADDHKEIIVDEFFKSTKIFYCYTKGVPLLEVFSYNFRTNIINRKQLYAPGEILDVALQRIDSTFVNIYLVYTKHSKLYLGKFENKDLSVTFREYPFIDRNVSSAELFINDEPEVFYWNSEGDAYHFKKAIIKTGPYSFKSYFYIPKSNRTKMNLYAADTYSQEYPSVVSLARNESEIFLLVIAADKFTVSNQVSNSAEKVDVQFGSGYFGETSIKGITNFTVNSINDNYISKMIYRENKNTYSLNKMLAAENVSDYFFARLDRKNYFLVNSNNKESHISIKSIKK